jgi:undecaprenyl-phosphate 4-deoxy-4-formamido-L-arabinose transferase
MNISVVIPVYNGAKTIEALVQRLGQVLPTVAEAFEVILVNDGSPDHSWEIIIALSKQYPWVRGVNLMRNCGQHNALLCGIRAACYEITITMDDDLQHPPEEIPKLLTRMQENFDVVYGVPRRYQHIWWRTLFAALTKRAVAWVMRIPSVQDIGSYRAFRTKIRQAFEHFRGSDVLIDVLLSWGTNRFASVTVEEDSRMAGKSNYNFAKLVRVSLLVLTSYTTAPLRFASIMGFLFTIFGGLVFLYVIITYLLDGSIPGFPFLASTITIFSGVQLFALGIFGEYLARVFNRTGGRPPYTIDTFTDKGLSAE